MEENEEEDDDENSHVGSPSPPYEGIITEEAEKQLESQGGDLNVKNMSEALNEVIIFIYLYQRVHLHVTGR